MPGAEPVRGGGEPQLGTVDPAWRIFLPPVALDREFWGFLALVTLVYAIALALLIPSFDAALEQEARRRGQVEGPPSISVEIVEDPEKPANAKHGSSAAEPPAAPPQPVAPPQQPAEPVTELKPTQPPEDAKPVDEAKAQPDHEPTPRENTQPDEKPRGEATTALEGVDLTLGRYTAALDAYMERQRRERAERRSSPPPRTSAFSGSSSLRGAPSSGKSDAYSRSVIAALLRAKPPPFALRGEVMVSFEISRSGGLVFVRVINSSGNKAMDAEAVAAIRRARFEPPPPDKTRQDLTYIIHFIFD